MVEQPQMENVQPDLHESNPAITHNEEHSVKEVPIPVIETIPMVVVEEVEPIQETTTSNHYELSEPFDDSSGEKVTISPAEIISINETTKKERKMGNYDGFNNAKVKVSDDGRFVILTIDDTVPDEDKIELTISAKKLCAVVHGRMNEELVNESKNVKFYGEV